MVAAPSRTRSPTARRWLSRGVRVAGTAAAVAWLVRTVDLGAAVDVLAAAPWWAFGVPLGVLGCNAGVQALRYRLLFSAAGAHLSLWVALRVVLQSLFLGQVVPRGGADVFRVMWLRQATGQTATTLAVLLVTRVFEVTVLGSLLVYGLWWGVAARWPWVGASAALFASAFVGVGGFAVAVGVFGDRLIEWVPFELLKRQGRQFLAAVRQMGQDRRRVAWAAVLTLPLSAGNLIAAWTVLTAYGVVLELSETLALVPAMDSVILLPVSVSGIGLREGVFVHVLGGLGVTEATAVAMALSRWSAELGRAALGGVLFLAGGTLSVHSPAAAEEEPR